MERTFLAIKNQLENVQEFVSESLKDANLSMKDLNMLNIVIEEIFINVASYSYDDGGNVTVRSEIKDNKIEITFIDQGKQFNPLQKDDPDISASADERGIGGLGIFMVKNLMDDVVYKYENNQNILTLVKNL